jgi:hypothetical protein
MGPPQRANLTIATPGAFPRHDPRKPTAPPSGGAHCSLSAAAPQADKIKKPRLHHTSKQIAHRDREQGSKRDRKDGENRLRISLRGASEDEDGDVVSIGFAAIVIDRCVVIWFGFGLVLFTYSDLYSLLWDMQATTILESVAHL